MSTTTIASAVADFYPRPRQAVTGWYVIGDDLDRAEAVAETCLDIIAALNVAVEHNQCSRIGKLARDAIVYRGLELFARTRDAKQMRVLAETVVAPHTRDPDYADLILERCWAGIGEGDNTWHDQS